MISKVPEASKMLKTEIDSIVFVDSYQFLRRGCGSKEGAYVSGGKKVAIIDFTQGDELDFLYAFFSALDDMTHKSYKEIYAQSEDEGGFARLLELQKFNSKLKVDKIMKAFFLNEKTESLSSVAPQNETSFQIHWDKFKKSSNFHKYDGFYQMFSSSTVEEHKGMPFRAEHEDEAELAGDLLESGDS